MYLNYLLLILVLIDSEILCIDNNNNNNNAVVICHVSAPSIVWNDANGFYCVLLLFLLVLYPDPVVLVCLSTKGKIGFLLLYPREEICGKQCFQTISPSAFLLESRERVTHISRTWVIIIPLFQVHKSTHKL